MRTTSRPRPGEDYIEAKAWRGLHQGQGLAKTTSRPRPGEDHIKPRPGEDHSQGQGLVKTTSRPRTTSRQRPGEDYITAGEMQQWIYKMQLHFTDELKQCVSDTAWSKA